MGDTSHVPSDEGASGATAWTWALVVAVVLTLVVGGLVWQHARATRCVPAASTSQVPLPPVTAAPSDVVTALVAAINAGDDTTARSLMTSGAWSRYAENGDAVSPSTFGQVCSIDGFRVTSTAPRDPEEATMNLPEFAQQYEVFGEAHLTPKTLWPFGPITPHRELDGIAGDDPDYYRQNYPESLASFASLFTLVRQTDSDRWLVEFLGDELV